MIKADFLVIGSGLAGLLYALEVASHGKVFIVTKRAAFDSNTRYAQGGIAAVLSKEDSIESHIQDTLNCGYGLCHPEIVQHVLTQAPKAIEQLMRFGVHFSKKHNKRDLDLGREGGHSHRRIVHAGDATGGEIQRALVHAIHNHPHITVLEHHFAINLIVGKKTKKTCHGAYVLHTKTGDIFTIQAKKTVLATGGAGKVYLYTSNPDIATGDGMAMAYRAGARMANLEFVQFHPTCLFHPEAKSFLISEAVRGEGGILRLENGHPFMKDHHPQKELAPRDVVARAIDHELKKTGAPCVYLDITHKKKSFIRDRFPTIHEKCLGFQIDITTQPIPVVPAAHYFCGGVITDNHGQTNIESLYAIGEVASTGLHGANRLASNSLLEAAVFAMEAAKHSVRNSPKTFLKEKITPWDSGQAIDSDEKVMISHNWDEIRRTMWNYVGLVRSNKRLLRAKRRIDLLHEEIEQFYWNFRITADLLELRNIACMADLIIRSALSRRESRGLHYTLNYPEENDAYLSDTVL